jgi:hypothetical protein
MPDLWKLPINTSSLSCSAVGDIANIAYIAIVCERQNDWKVETLLSYPSYLLPHHSRTKNSMEKCNKGSL